MTNLGQHAPCRATASRVGLWRHMLTPCCTAMLNPSLAPFFFPAPQIRAWPLFPRDLVITGRERRCRPAIRAKRSRVVAVRGGGCGDGPGGCDYRTAQEDMGALARVKARARTGAPLRTPDDCGATGERSWRRLQPSRAIRPASTPRCRARVRGDPSRPQSRRRPWAWGCRGN